MKLAATLALLLASAVPSWGTYAYKRTVTIDHTKCGSADSTNFPFEFIITDNTFKLVGSGGRINNSNGYDIAFYSDSGLTLALFWEIERYDSSAGQFIAWVKIPTLSHTVDTVIYVAYSDPAISTFQSTATSVWDTNFKLVQHLKDGTTLSVSDSTTNANSITNHSATAAAGEIDGAAVFNGSSQYIDGGTGSSIAALNLSAATYEFWINVSSYSSNFAILAKNDGNTVNAGWWITFIATPALYTAGFFFTSEAAGADMNSSSSATPSTNAWHHVAVVGDGSQTYTNQIIYVDGISASITGANGAGIQGSDTSQNLLIGQPNPTIYNSTSPYGYFPGTLDEIRLSNSARSSSWILAEYNNGSNSGGFETIGAETPTSGSVRRLLVLGVG